MLFRILDFLIATFGKVVYNKALELSFALLTGLKRSCMCCDVNETMIGQEVTVMGWVQRSRSADSRAVRFANRTKGLPPKAVPEETLRFPNPSAT